MGKPRFIPVTLDLDLSGLRHATFGSIPFGPNWVPLLMAISSLQHLILHGLYWWGHSSYGNSPLYLPHSPPSVRLKRLEIIRSHVKEAPLRWLLSGGSSETLAYLEVSYLQAEWDTFKIYPRHEQKDSFPMLLISHFQKPRRVEAHTSITKKIPQSL